MFVYFVNQSSVIKSTIQSNSFYYIGCTTKFRNEKSLLYFRFMCRLKNKRPDIIKSIDLANFSLIIKVPL